MTVRQIIYTKPFLRDAKKHYSTLITPRWAEVVLCLYQNDTLPEKFKDHALTGNWQGFRDCHVKPDLLLIYKINDDVVEFHRLNTHAELFG